MPVLPVMFPIMIYLVAWSLPALPRGKSCTGDGHTACGAVRGAIDGVELGHLTGLLNQIKPAITKTEFSGERTGKNAQFVDAVAKSNVLHTIEEIRKQSEILRGLEKEGKIKIVGAMYNLNGGAVEFVS